MTEEIKEVLQVENDGQLPAEERELQFRGNPFKLKISLWSLIQLQEVHGLKLDDLSTGDDSDMEFSVLIKLVWAGLQDQYEDVTFKEVAQSFEIGDISAISTELNRAMTASTAVGKPAIAAGLALA